MAEVLLFDWTHVSTFPLQRQESAGEGDGRGGRKAGRGPQKKPERRLEKGPPPMICMFLCCTLESVANQFHAPVSERHDFASRPCRKFLWAHGETGARQPFLVRRISCLPFLEPNMSFLVMFNLREFVCVLRCAKSVGGQLNPGPSQTVKLLGACQKK